MRPLNGITRMKLSTAIQAYLDCVKQLKANYDLVGPGNVDQALYHQVQSAFAKLDAIGDKSNCTAETQQQIRDSTKTLNKMCHLCACDSAGLCFVPGEAGLIARADYAEQFAAAIETLEISLKAIRSR